MLRIIFITSVMFMSVFINSCKSPALVKQATPKTASPISIEGLNQRTYNATLSFERKLQGTEKYDSDLYSYFSDNLKIYALINTPKTPKPTNGFPVLIFGHGFHPEPKQYGVSNQTGKDWRPGDYYRGIPEAYAEKGFIVITPDYRGHNKSDGFEYTQTSYLASSYYAIDVLNLISARYTFPKADADRIFYMGHSMGGEVGLKMLLATNKIKAASIWCGVSASILEQAIYYGQLSNENRESITPSLIQKYMTRVDSVVQQLDFKHDIRSGEPIHFLQNLNTPLIIHHSTDDLSVPYQWSESLVAKLYAHEKEFEFYSYESADHLFKGADRIKAVERDLAFFRKW